MHLLAASGSTATVERVEILDRTATVYTIEVPGLHTYFVSDEQVLVHNTCAPNPWGRRGSPLHRPAIRQIENGFAVQGWKWIAGGAKLDEDKYGDRFADLMMRRDGKEIAFQVGHGTLGGNSIWRERAPLADLRGGHFFNHVFFIGF